MTAATIAKIDGTFADLARALSGFMESLATDWRGWDGEEMTRLAADLTHFLGW
jgi:hypothetical protein